MCVRFSWGLFERTNYSEIKYAAITLGSEYDWQYALWFLDTSTQCVESMLNHDEKL